MYKRAIIITTILLILAIGNFFRLTPLLNVRDVDIISILAIGVLVGVLITLLFISKK